MLLFFFRLILSGVPEECQRCQRVDRDPLPAVSSREATV